MNKCFFLFQLLTTGLSYCTNSTLCTVDMVYNVDIVYTVHMVYTTDMVYIADIVYTVHMVYTVDMVCTVEIREMRGITMGKTGPRAETRLGGCPGVIFKLTFARGGPGVFSN